MTLLKELKLSNAVMNALRIGNDDGWHNGKHGDGPEFFVDYYSIGSIEELISVGLKGLIGRQRMGKKAISEIIYALDEYSKIYKCKYIKEEFIKLPEKPKKINIPQFNLNNEKKSIGYIYAIEAEEIFTKIGLSKDFPTKRLSNLQTSCPLELKLKGYIKTENMNSDEKKLHNIFDKYHKRGEWFKLSYRDARIIALENSIEFEDAI
jgi:hypothetical protein